ncbi:MAG TPA: hypothetical protein VGH85_21940, partial [Mycobacteriales bacterium]
MSECIGLETGCTERQVVRLAEPASDTRQIAVPADDDDGAGRRSDRHDGVAVGVGRQDEVRNVSLAEKELGPTEPAPELPEPVGRVRHPRHDGEVWIRTKPPLQEPFRPTRANAVEGAFPRRRRGRRRNRRAMQREASQLCPEAEVGIFQGRQGRLESPELGERLAGHREVAGGCPWQVTIAAVEISDAGTRRLVTERRRRTGNDGAAVGDRLQNGFRPIRRHLCVCIEEGEHVGVEHTSAGVP